MKNLFAKTILATLITTALVGCNTSSENNDTVVAKTEVKSEAIDLISNMAEPIKNANASNASEEVTPKDEVVETVSDAELLPDWISGEGPSGPYTLKGLTIEGSLFRTGYGEAVYLIEDGEYGINELPSILQSHELDNRYRVLGAVEEPYIALDQEGEFGETLIAGKVIIRGKSDYVCDIVYGVIDRDGELVVDNVNLKTSCLID